jgi:hypothetical protein
MHDVAASHLLLSFRGASYLFPKESCSAKRKVWKRWTPLITLSEGRKGKDETGPLVLNRNKQRQTLLIQNIQSPKMVVHPVACV